MGEGWKPNLRLVSVVNSLYYLLSDPNPNNVFNDPRCLEAAKICSKHGFPMMSSKGQKASPDDTARFNIIPLPSGAHTQQSDKKDVVKFTILRPKRP